MMHTARVEAASQQRSLGRLSEIGRVATRHGFGYVLERRRTPPDEPPAERGRRLREMLDELGPTFVKFGQLLSTRPDIVPPDIVVELRKLQDDVSPVPFDQIEAVINAELGLTVEQAFLRFDERPIAAASIGQVHRATLPDGGRGRREGAAADSRRARSSRTSRSCAPPPASCGTACGRSTSSTPRGSSTSSAARSGRSSTTSTRRGTPRRSGATSATPSRS